MAHKCLTLAKSFLRLLEVLPAAAVFIENLACCKVVFLAANLCVVFGCDMHVEGLGKLETILAKSFVVLEVGQEPGKSIMKLKALGAGLEESKLDVKRD